MLGNYISSLTSLNFLRKEEVALNKTLSEIFTHKESIVKAIISIKASHGVLSHVREFRVLIANYALDFADGVASSNERLDHRDRLAIFAIELVEEDFLDVGLVLRQ